MFGLFISLALLGLSAVDPVGIAAMPILLLQKHPLQRSFLFLGGSFVSLMAFGLLFAKGFGGIVLHFEKAHTWLVPTAELIAGLVLLGIAGSLLWRLKHTGSKANTPSVISQRLSLHGGFLFIVGAALVAVQSVVDVVFVIAMIRIGQLNLHTFILVAAVATYSLTALLLQFVVVAAYQLTPADKRSHTLNKVHRLLTRYGDQVVAVICLLLGGLLLVLAAQG